jgi:type I restriction enzyme S subunit
MIADLKPYSEYKDSGSRWLAEVPDHWEVRNLRTLIRPRTERNRADLPLLSVAREKGVFVRSLTDPSENHNVIPEDLSNYKVARGGDLVINKMKAWQGSMGIAPCDGIVSPAYYVFEFGIENAGFGQKLLRSKPYVAHFGQASDGVRVGQWDLSIPGMRLIPVLVPPPAEQAAIVRFLDHWNGRLEKAIRSKRRVIALLQEQKQAIIHRAVTRGLDPKVKLKESGVSWLGRIPEHWESMPNRANLKIRKKLVGERSSEYTLLSLTMRGVIARDMENPTGKFPAEFNTYQEVRPGDLIFCLFDIDETPRGVGISRLNGMITGAYTVFEPRNPEIAEFLYLHYLAMDEEKCLKPLYTGLRKTIPKPRFLGIKTPIPPPDERIAIVRHIKEETVRIDTIIARYEREITLLREYRTRLTADVVTGKLDVRAAAAQLPEETEEEPLPDPEVPEEETELEEVEA